MIKKKLFLLISCLILVIALELTVSASDKTSEIDKNFQKYITNCFENQNNTIIYDLSETDITDEFFEDNFEHFNQNDFFKIKSYIDQYVSKISFLEIQEPDITTYSPSKSKTVTNTEMKKLTPNSILSPFYVEATIKGTFSYNTNTGEIVSYGNPSISNITFYDKPYGMYAQAYNISVNTPTKQTNGFSVLFSGNYSVKVSSDAQYVTITDNFPAISISVTGKAD